MNETAVKGHSTCSHDGVLYTSLRVYGLFTTTHFYPTNCHVTELSLYLSPQERITHFLLKFHGFLC